MWRRWVAAEPEKVKVVGLPTRGHDEKVTVSSGQWADAEKIEVQRGPCKMVFDGGYDERKQGTRARALQRY